MKNIRRMTAVAALVLLACFLLLQAQNGEQFYESSYDGAWAGSIRMATAAGPREFPLVLNLNLQGQSGIGFALLADDLTLAPSDMEVFPLTELKPAGKKITAKIEGVSPQNGESGAETATHTLTLKYNAAKGFLKGNLKTTDPALKKGKIFLYRQSGEFQAQKVWSGTVKKDGVKTTFFLQLIQKDAIDGGATTVSALTGFGFLGSDYGKFTVGSFDGTDITGVLILPGESVAVGLKTAKQKFKGNVVGNTFSSSVTMQPAGTKGKALAVNMAAPTKLTLGMSTAVEIGGRNMHPGVIAHLDNADVLVSEVVNATKKKTGASLMPDIALAGDLKIALRVTGLDGQVAEIADAFATSTEGMVQPVSFINDVQPILTASCSVSGCHSATTAAAGLNLTSSSYSRIVNVSSSQMSTLFQIKPLDPDNSYLLRKIKGSGINGSQMPRGRTPLDVEVIALIENWIRQGALNN